MKKYLAILMVLAMALSGCAALQTVNDLICNPTPTQQADATKMIVALDAAQAVGAIFYPVIGIAQASAVLTTIRDGGCFLVAQLKEAFAAVDAANAATAKAQLKMLKGPVPALPEYPALRVLVK